MEPIKNAYSYNKDTTNTSTAEIFNTPYNNSKHHTVFGVAGLITPQRSTTNSKYPSRAHSRQHSLIKNMDKLRINNQQSNTASNTSLEFNHHKNNNNYSNRSSHIDEYHLNLSSKPRASNTKSHSKSSKRRSSLSVKETINTINDAYVGIKQMISKHGRYSNSRNINQSINMEEKIYYKVILDDPLNVVLSDQDGLSRFADHLCSEFSIENLLFIVEALQYRYCIPCYLFDEPEHNQSRRDEMEYENSSNHSPKAGDGDKDNKSDCCHLLMHIIHQNKKLPISKSLKQHSSYCIDMNNKNNSNKNITNSPSRTISSPEKVDGVDFNINTDSPKLTAIRKKSQINSNKKERDNKCCKKCAVEKFKYIIEKYVRTTSINLPSAIQRKLISIWNELQIKDPDKRFIDKKIDKKVDKKMDKKE